MSRVASWGRRLLRGKPIPVLDSQGGSERKGFNLMARLSALRWKNLVFWLSSPLVIVWVSNRRREQMERKWDL